MENEQEEELKRMERGGAKEGAERKHQKEHLKKICQKLAKVEGRAEAVRSKRSKKGEKHQRREQVESAIKTIKCSSCSQEPYGAPANSKSDAEYFEVCAAKELEERAGFGRLPQI